MIEGSERGSEWMRRVDSRNESIWRVSVTYIVDALVHSLWRKLGRDSKGWKKVTRIIIS